MQNFIVVIQIMIACILIVVILVQVKGVGFGRVWGGQASFARRGLEKLVFKLTFVFSFIFILTSILALIA